MPPERVRCADDGVGGNELECAVGDVVVRGDHGGPRIEVLSTRHMPPARDRTKLVVAGQRRDDDEHGQWNRAGGQSLDAEDRSDYERWNQSGRVVEMNRGLR